MYDASNCRHLASGTSCITRGRIIVFEISSTMAVIKLSSFTDCLAPAFRPAFHEFAALGSGTWATHVLGLGVSGRSTLGLLDPICWPVVSYAFASHAWAALAVGKLIRE